MEPLLWYSLADDHVWIDLIRTWEPGQFADVMDRLRQIAQQHGKTLLRGQVLGRARLRLFRMRGWVRIGVLPGQKYLIEYRL